jgi:hypothetical protein
LLNMEGHADVVAAKSRTEERTADGRMIASTMCGVLLCRVLDTLARVAYDLLKNGA